MWVVTYTGDGGMWGVAAGMVVTSSDFLTDGLRVLLLSAFERSNE